MIEIHGTDANIPPIKELLLDTSDITTINNPEIINLSIEYHIGISCIKKTGFDSKAF